MKTAFRLSLIALSLTIATSACTKKADTDPSTPGQTPPAGDTTGTGKGPDTQSTETGKTGTAGSVEKANEAALRKLLTVVSLAEMIKKNDIGREVIMLNIGDDSVSVSDYRHALKTKQDQIKQVLQNNPDQRKPLLELANKENIQLEPEETKSLIEQGKVQLGKDYDKYLKENKLTEKQFQDQMLEMGRALKTANRAIEAKLLMELVNTSIVVDQARKEGLSKTAFNRFVEFKKTPGFEEAFNNSDLTPDQLQDKLIEGFLAESMLKKVVETSSLPDSKILELYNQSKEQFKHNGRMHWAQIVIAAPVADMGAVESIKSQIIRQFPDLKGEALLKKVAEAEEAQHQKALSIIKQINGGKSFESLANEFTDDMPARQAKKGGDMGFVGKDDLKTNQLLSKVGEELGKMKTGEVSKEPVRTMFGWHILKMVEKQNPGYVPFSEVKDQLKQVLTQQQSNLAINQWLLTKLRTIPIRIDKNFEKYVDAAPKKPEPKAPDAKAPDAKTGEAAKPQAAKEGAAPVADTKTTPAPAK